VPVTGRTQQRNLVLISHETADGRLCVDLFRRPDGSFGYEEYRRDPDDGAGWYPVGGAGEVIFGNETDALEAARKHVGWLNGVLRPI